MIKRCEVLEFSCHDSARCWRTRPQKEFIQSRADTFTYAFGAFCADSL